MKWWKLLLVAAVGVGCGPGGDGQVVSCSCEIYYVEGTTFDSDGPLPISLCETSSTEDHTAEAEAACGKIGDTFDPENVSHMCACSCVQLVEPCDTE